MTAAMIFESDAPSDPTCGELQALHLALNRPVVMLGCLPVGPASAAVALHANGAGTTLAVRSLRTGQLAFFTPAAELRDRPEVALAATLSFGEGMGFLFDDDEVAALGHSGPELAARRWREWIGDPVEAELEPSLDVGIPSLPPGDPSAEIHRGAFPGSPAHEQVLSKFRWVVFGAEAVAEALPTPSIEGESR